MSLHHMHYALYQVVVQGEIISLKVHFSMSRLELRIKGVGQGYYVTTLLNPTVGIANININMPTLMKMFNP